MIKKLCLLLLLSASLSCSIFAASPDAPTIYRYLQQHGMQHFESWHADSLEDVEGVEHNWSVLVFFHRGEQRMVVFDRATRQRIYTYSHESMFGDFVRLQWVKLDSYPSPLIASVWLLGTHGQRFVLSSPLGHKVLYQLNSSWPLGFYVSDKEIAITITGDRGNDGIPVEEVHHWSAPGVVTIQKSGE